MKKIDFHIDGDRDAYARAYRVGEPVSADAAPDYIYFHLHDLPERRKASMPDMLAIVGGLIVISQKLHDLMSQFDLGDGEMFEVPLYEHDQKTRRPGRWYILHVAGYKPTVIPEKSENIEPVGDKGHWGQKRISEEAVLAVHASAAQGADIWMDPFFKSRIFLSDRLKTAIQKSGLKIRFLPMRPCVVIEDAAS